MSPKPVSEKPKTDMSSSTAMRRRRAADAEAQRAADLAAAAAAGEPAAVAAERGSTAAAVEPVAAAEPAAASDLQMIGQELVPASSALVVVDEKGKGMAKGSETPEVKGSNRAEATGGFQTPGQETQLALVETKTPNSKLSQSEEEKMTRQARSREVTPNGPSGPPLSLGPPANLVHPASGTQTPNMPLFTPEQVQEMNGLYRQTPILMQSQGRLSAGSGFATVLQAGLGRVPDQLALPDPGIDPLAQEGHLLAPGGLPPTGMDRAIQEWQEAQRQEAAWRAHMQMSLERLALQLRASQTENLRLKDELRRAADKSSCFNTPEDKSKVDVTSHEEDGTAVRQGRRSSSEGEDRRNAIIRAQEELIANFQQAGGYVSSKEDGTRVQQEQEDGTAVQQAEEEDSEDGAESRQESSEESDGWQIPEQGGKKEDPSRRRRKSGSKDQTLEVILKLMQGMQTMQQQMMKGREDKKDEAEFVRQAVELPKLPEWDAETAPIDYADWALCLGAHMGDLSNTSEAWWSKIMDTARRWYERHMLLTPIERLTHSPQTTDELKSAKWSRLEKRASALLLACIPEALKEEVISSKQVSTLGILCKAMIQYQPGGLAERAAILNALEQPQEAQTTGAAAAQLRKWIRWRRRAAELGVSMPDATILVRGISKLLRKVVAGHPDLSFRLSLARNTLLIDTVPTQETVSQYSEHALAELEQLGLQSRKQGSTEQTAKIRKFEEQPSRGGEEGYRGRGKPKEEYEAKKAPCRFFLSEEGCRRGKKCPYGHVMDQEKRCWGCGSKSHLSNACPREEETKTAKISKASKGEKAQKQESKPVENPKESKPESGGDEAADTMQILLDEANRMIKSLETTEVSEKRSLGPMSKGAKLVELQGQLDALKKASLRPFRISKLGTSSTRGLIDSGATHPLRARKPGEKTEHLPKVSVTLAGDQEIQMHLTPSGVIVGAPGTEPIVPMGLLASVLGCSVSWSAEGLQVNHPDMGTLEVVVVDGCPMVEQDVALELIAQLEKKVSARLKALHLCHDPEMEFIQKVVDQHPAFKGLPEEVRKALVEKPTEDLKELGNRRHRKLWKREGMVVHMFSGSTDGYTLKRAFHEVGGDKRLMLELDLLHGKETADLGPEGKAYGSLLRLALDGIPKAWVGGPPCRTRSVLRHRVVEGLDLPRPVRAWGGAEHGLPDLRPSEKQQVLLDDILMMRFVLLYVITDLVRKIRKESQPTEFLLEQPAIPAKEEVVSWWKRLSGESWNQPMIFRGRPLISLSSAVRRPNQRRSAEPSPWKLLFLGERVRLEASKERQQSSFVRSRGSWHDGLRR